MANGHAQGACPSSMWSRRTSRRAYAYFAAHPRVQRALIGELAGGRESAALRTAVLISDVSTCGRRRERDVVSLRPGEGPSHSAVHGDLHISGIESLSCAAGGDVRRGAERGDI